MANHASEPMEVDEPFRPRKRRADALPGHGGAVSSTAHALNRMSLLDIQPSPAHFALRAPLTLARQPISRPSGQSVNSVDYCISPNPDLKFNASLASDVMLSVLISFLKGEKYDRLLTESLAENLAEAIVQRMNIMGFSKRYKFISQVTMGQKNGQGAGVASRCIWNTNTDNFASASYSKGDLFVTATLYAVYSE